MSDLEAVAKSGSAQSVDQLADEIRSLAAERDQWKWEYEQEKRAGDVWREQATELATEIGLWKELAELREKLHLHESAPTLPGSAASSICDRILSLKERLGEP